MTNSEDKTNWIDQYLDGHLDGTELLVFERKMAREPDFRLEVEAQKVVRFTLEECGAKKLPHPSQHQENYISREEGVSNFIFPVPQKTRWEGKLFVFVITTFLILLLLNGLILWLNHRPVNDMIGTANSYQIFNVSVHKTHSEAKQPASPLHTADSQIVQIFASRQHLDHYQFKDTLTIFLEDPSVKDVRLEFDSQTNRYILILDGVRYKVERGATLSRTLQREKAK